MNQRRDFRLHDTSIPLSIRRTAPTRLINASRGKGGALEGKWQEVTLWDISAGGLSFVYDDDGFERGDRLELRVNLANLPGIPPLVLRAQVMGGTSHKNFQRRNFCRFEGVRSSDQDTLQGHLFNRQRMQLQEQAQKEWDDDQEWQEQEEAWEAEADDEALIEVEEDQPQQPAKKRGFRFGDPLPKQPQKADDEKPPEGSEQKQEAPQSGGGNQRQHERFDEVIPFAWRKVEEREYLEAKRFYDADKPLPAPFTSGYQPIDVEPLEKSWAAISVQNHITGQTLAELWKKVDSLCSQVSATKKINLFVPLRDQLIKTTSSLVTLNQIGTLQSENLKRMVAIIDEVFAAQGMTTQDQLKQRRELIRRVREELRTSKRRGSRIQDGMWELFEKLENVIDKVNQYGHDHVFGHTPQDVNVSAGGVAWAEESSSIDRAKLGLRKSKHQEVVPLKRGDHVAVRVGLKGTPWVWVVGYGEVVMVKPLSRRANAQQDTSKGIYPPRRVAMQFTLITDEDTDALVKATHNKQLEERRKQYLDDLEDDDFIF
uniref:PilZ domain-containing protein n=1 Tax=Magnetococcus massalia (strain MO-1) TaxID=451514 RepID=A0A1S7LLI4_MAGMO|nr:Protein of unknown function [Candidatus Magnetococcus massalia]